MTPWCRMTDNRGIPKQLPSELLALLCRLQRYTIEDIRAVFYTCLWLLEGRSQGWNTFLLPRQIRQVPGHGTNMLRFRHHHP